ncbi:hypothetical protein [Nocardioides sp. SYSU D00065]|uniref:hypothetical protein n=1 Tax=Nocardioides sp. SYSU D00065 TaxID=2817378 RepID=UPI001B32CB7E|nr:hypothetical protein [Nocardioides sp. SYSU D00065]
MPVIFRGKPACTCLAAWLPAYERELRARDVLAPKARLSIYQLIGGAAASGGTHTTGGAFDITNLPGDVDVWVARQMGADATWDRTMMSPRHIHGVLRGCPHNGPARYQIASVDRGDNGLDGSASAGPDDGPRPLSGRSWEEGIAWHREQAKVRRRAALTARIQPLLEEKRKLTALIGRLREKRAAL